MSTLASTIIALAFREGNLIPVGKTPTVQEQTEALARLNTLVLGVFGVEMGEYLQDWEVPSPQRTAPTQANFPQLPYPLGTDSDLLGSPMGDNTASQFAPYPPKNSRIIFGGVTTTVYFPQAPDNGSRMGVAQGSGAGDGGAAGQILTLNGNGRTINGSNTVALTDPVTAQEWLYRSDLANWVPMTTMALSDTLPFPPELDDLWVCLLAMRLGPSMGKVADPDTVRTATRMMQKLQTMYKQAGTTTYKSGDVPNSWQSYAGNNRWWWN